MERDNLPEKVRRRIDLSGLFYRLDRNAERRWGRALQTDFTRFLGKLQEKADELNYRQVNPQDDVIIWREQGAGSVECLFYLVKDATDIDKVSAVYDLIREYQPFFTYAFIHQRKDGDHCWDIFRFSRFSYLEHCNRVYGVKKKL